MGKLTLAKVDPNMSTFVSWLKKNQITAHQAMLIHPVTGVDQVCGGSGQSKVKKRFIDDDHQSRTVNSTPIHPSQVMGGSQPGLNLSAQGSRHRPTILASRDGLRPAGG
jgi:hypothetical protein